MKHTLSFIIILFLPLCLLSQGFNHTWLIGYDIGANKGRLNFNASGFQYFIEQRDMGFEGTQGNICDENGNFLMSSNGVWIANANNDTMMNGSGLNPGSFVNSWPNGLPIPHGNIILPWPDSSHKFVLIHQTNNSMISPSEELYYSVININLDGGLGGLVEKNTIFTIGNYAWGLSACKHANGRDWWIAAVSDSATKIFTFLLTPSGIQYNSTQTFSVPSFAGSSVRPLFSPDGKKFAYVTNSGGNRKIYLYEFDRCNGNLFQPILIDISDGFPGAGIAFSPNSKYLYSSSTHKIFQLNTDTIDVPASNITIAINDTFYSPFSWCCLNDFWLMYLAANGRIYVTSGSSVAHIHQIMLPNSYGSTSDVQQHSVDLNGVWNFRAVPNHPNYYLGCDTTLGCTPCFVYIDEVKHDFKFNIYPNPSSGTFNIIYLLPQNKEGKLEVFDINGRIVFSYNLPQWSTLQQFNLNHLAQGIYAIKIRSDGYNVTKKVIITE